MKRIYKKPEVKSVKIDNQISMIMMSPVPPTGPGEGSSINMQQSNVANPYKVAKA